MSVKEVIQYTRRIGGAFRDIVPVGWLRQAKERKIAIIDLGTSSRI
jgi:hypothetical protein